VLMKRGSGVMGKGEARFLYRTIFSANKRDSYFLGGEKGCGFTHRREVFFRNTIKESVCRYLL
jgi:hypothetical protein